jgi:hypothetical protein
MKCSVVENRMNWMSKSGPEGSVKTEINYCMLSTQQCKNLVLA